MSTQPTPGSAPEEIQFEASGLGFGALAWGPSAGPLALCLHGYPDTAWTFRHLGADLAQRGWRVVAPFQRGYAPTALAPDGCYQLGALARDALGAHTALGGDRHAVLIGHDWGAVAGYVTGSFAPEVFARIVTLAVPPLPVMLGPVPQPRQTLADPLLTLRQLRNSWYILFQQVPGAAERVFERLVARLWADWSPAYDATDDLAHLRDALGDRAHRTAALRYYRAFLQPWYRSSAYATEQAHQMKIPSRPVLYLHGSDDGCLSVKIAQRAPAVLAPESHFETIRGAGHFLHLEQPRIVNRLIGEFIDG